MPAPPPLYLNSNPIPTPTTPKRGYPPILRRQELDAEGYPTCQWVDADVETCYPAGDTVVYQNEWTRLIWNTQYTLFFSDDGDGMIDIYLRNADSDEIMLEQTRPRAMGLIKLQVDDAWFDSRAVREWDGQPRNWSFYWTVVPAGYDLSRGGETRQPVFTVVQTALPNYAISSSAGAPTGTNSVSGTGPASGESTNSSNPALQNNADDGSNFPPWAIALVVVLGVITLVSILSLVFVLQRHMRRKSAERRDSMGSSSPMMAGVAGDPVSPTRASTVGHGRDYIHPASLPPPVRPAPSVRHDGASIHSRNTEGVISGSDAQIMADAFRKALRKPDFTDRPQEEGESPEAAVDDAETQLLKSQLEDEGRNIRSVGSERGVKVVVEDTDSETLRRR